MRFKKIIIVFILLLISAAGVSAQQSTKNDAGIPVVMIRDLVMRSAIYEGRTVILRGEVIGDIMPRGQFAWINIQGQYNEIGVWIPLELTKRITYKGNYRFKGDRVEVLGIFKHADEEFGGEFCLRAIDLKIIQPGFPSPHQQSPIKKHIVWSLFWFTLCLLVIRFLVPRVRKKKDEKNDMGF
ncbi:MAG: hypothetical protein H6753_06725 [Candidatus Omnitrophica bacterium]|nr:hypothetical protein [Candidatus Omnitrophota bacterium]